MIQLTNSNINDTINKIKLQYSKEGVDKTQLISTTIFFEEILLYYQEKYSKDTKIDLKFKKEGKILYTEIDVKCKCDDPFQVKLEKSEDKEETIYDQLFSKLKVYPKHEYSHGCNKIIFGVKLISTTFKENSKFCWNFMGEKKSMFVTAVVLQAITAVANVIVPLITAYLIVAYTESAFIQIILMAMGICTINVGVSLLNWIIVNLYNRVFYQIKSNIVLQACEETTRIRNLCLDLRGAGLFIRRLTTDVDLFSTGLQKIAEQILIIANYAGILISVLIVNIWCFIIIFVTLLVGIIIERKRTRNYKKNDRVYRISIERYSNVISQLVNGLKDIKLFNGRKNIVLVTKKYVENSNVKGLKMYDNNFKYRFIREASAAFFDLVYMCMLGIFLCTSFFGITAAEVLVLFNYKQSLGPQAIISLGTLVDSIREFNLSGERLIALIEDTEFPKDEFGSKKIKNLKGKIEARNLNFAYNHDDPRENDKNILNNLNFKIDPGTHVGIVGKTGTGKTTILNLIGKIYDIYEGEILLDDVSINDLDEETIRTNTITIPQNPYLFDMSIKDNFKIVDKNISDEKIEEACKVACIDNYFKKLRSGYATIIGENGISLSGGQRQRLAIARSMLSKSSIILFDESTSALDNITQKKVIRNIKKYKKNCTILMVAHRLSTIKDMDKIFFIDGGKVIAEGTHETLMKNCKSYKQLYESE